MRTWQLQEARSRFSELVSAALARGPQRVTRHGKSAVIVVSEADWQEVTRKIPSFGQLLAQCPLDPEDLPKRSHRRRGRSRHDGAGMSYRGRHATLPPRPASAALRRYPACRRDWLERNSEHLHLS